MVKSNNGSLKWIGILLIVAVGVIHLIDASSSFQDATYKGIMFVANGIGAFIAAIGIYQATGRWGWALGLFVSASAFAGYIISRTVGLPGIPPDVWLEPLGVASLLAEALFIITAIVVLKREPARKAR